MDVPETDDFVMPPGDSLPPDAVDPWLRRLARAVISQACQDASPHRRGGLERARVFCTFTETVQARAWLLGAGHARERAEYFFLAGIAEPTPAAMSDLIHAGGIARGLAADGRRR